MTGDWGNWADAYHFVQSPQCRLREPPTSPRWAMKQLKVNVMLIVDLNGTYRLVQRAGFRQRRAALDLDFTAAKALPEDFPWRKNLADGKPARGLLRTNRGRHDDCRRRCWTAAAAGNTWGWCSWAGC